jgi:predicted transcriptional regulator
MRPTIGTPNKDKKIDVMVYNPQQIKEVRLAKIMNILKANATKILSVEDIAYYVGLDTKTTRKYLRLLRNQHPDQIKYVKAGVKTYYVYQPNEKSMEEISKLINKKNIKTPKTIIALNVKDQSLLERLQKVDLETVLTKVLEELAKQNEESLEDNIEDTLEDSIEDNLEDNQ